jgi:hypothetical protein
MADKLEQVAIRMVEQPPLYSKKNNDSSTDEENAWSKENGKLLAGTP